MEDIVICADVEGKKFSIKQMQAKEFKQSPSTIYYVMVPAHMRESIDVIGLQMGGLNGLGMHMESPIPVMLIGIGQVRNGKMYVRNPITNTEMIVPDNLDFFITPPQFD